MDAPTSPNPLQRTRRERRGCMPGITGAGSVSRVVGHLRHHSMALIFELEANCVSNEAAKRFGQHFIGLSFSLPDGRSVRVSESDTSFFNTRFDLIIGDVAIKNWKGKWVKHPMIDIPQYNFGLGGIPKLGWSFVCPVF